MAHCRLKVELFILTQQEMEENWYKWLENLITLKTSVLIDNLKFHCFRMNEVGSMVALRQFPEIVPAYVNVIFIVSIRSAILLTSFYSIPLYYEDTNFII